MRLAYKNTEADMAEEQELALDLAERMDPSQHGRALIAALAMGELFTVASPAQASGFYRAVGQRLAAQRPIPHMRDLRELERAANTVWAGLGLGHADITLEVQGVVIRHCDAPESIEGDNGRHWDAALPALLEGAYDGWLRALGSPEALVTRVISRTARCIEIRHGALADG